MAYPADPVETRGGPVRVMDDGTPRALQPLAAEVLAWVAEQRASAPFQTEYDNPVDPDAIRRIELCAQAVINLDRLTASFTAEGVPCVCTQSASPPSSSSGPVSPSGGCGNSAAPCR